MVPGAVSGSMTSFRMSYEIVPVCPAGMSRYIDPGECLMVCVWVPNLHEEMDQNDYCGTTRSG